MPLIAYVNIYVCVSIVLVAMITNEASQAYVHQEVQRDQ